MAANRDGFSLLKVLHLQQLPWLPGISWLIVSSLGLSNVKESHILTIRRFIRAIRELEKLGTGARLP